eukprot:200775-Chlamydomonas_euryale.AAC.10
MRIAQGPLRYQSCGSPPSSRPAKAKNGRTARKSNGRCSPSSEELAPVQVKAPTQPKAVPVKTPAHRPNKNHGSQTSSMGSSPRIAACPAFFSSPKPDAIPMPTVGFLNKAATIAGPHCMPADMQQVPRMTLSSAAA